MQRMVEYLDGRPVAAPFAGLARPAEDGFAAFGLALEPLPGETPEAAWLVAWTAPLAADPEEVPRFAVGNRRVVRTSAGEIQCAFTPEAPSPE